MRPQTIGSATELAQRIRARELSSLELVELCLDRIKLLDPALNAVVTVDAGRARAQARELDREAAAGGFRGPLHGLPCTVKDSIAVAGLRSTGGAREYADYYPAADAPVVGALRSAGAVVLGKTNVPRWAGDYQSHNGIFGTTNNPWDVTCTPGGSSGGAAAAVAAGLTVFDIGTDIAGSIRLPASFCGIAGHRPSQGIVPDQGYLHYVGSGNTSTDLNVFGPLARSVADLELVLDVITGATSSQADGWSLTLPPAAVPPWRVGVLVDDDECPVRADVLEATEAAAAALAADGSDVRFSAPAVSLDETREVFLPLLGAATSPSRVGGEPDPSPLTHVDWLLLQDRREAIRDRWAQWFAGHDLLLMPVFPVAAFQHDTQRPFHERTVDVNGRGITHVACARRLAYPTLVGLPATVVRVGTSREGLPIGVQLIGPYLGDRTTLAAARRLEALLGGFVPPPLASVSALSGVAVVDDHGLGLQVREQPLAAAFAAYPGLLVAAEGHAEIGAEGVVPDRARPQSAGDRHRPAGVRGEDRRVQPVDRVVGERHRVVFVAGRDDGQHRAENLLLRDHRAVVNVREDGGLHEVAARQVRRAPTADDESGAVGDTPADV
jgi:amidase